MAKKEKEQKISDTHVSQIIDWALANSMMATLSIRTSLTVSQLEKAGKDPSSISNKVKSKLANAAEKSGFKREDLEGIKADLILALEWIKAEGKNQKVSKILGLAVAKEFRLAAENGDVSDRAAQIVINAATELGWEKK